jgi:hypothetical protein
MKKKPDKVIEFPKIKGPGRPPLPKHLKRRSIHIKLTPEAIKALDKIGNNRTRIIEYALEKTYNIKVR